MTEFGHQPVMAREVLAALQLQASGVYVDATFGRGGHAREILSRLGPHGRLLVMDRDPEAVAAARSEFGGDARVVIVKGWFSMLEQYIRDCGLAGQINGIVLDLGVSFPQLSEPARGFSFTHDGPLDMRMDPGTGEPAHEWLNRASEEDLREVIRAYGEERFAARIARAIVTERGAAPIETTGRLARIVAQAVPTREQGKHPATRTFQAIRIQVNKELDELRAVLPQAVRVLATGGRLVVLSFQSLEDRLVKRFLRRAAKGDPYPPNLPVPETALQPCLRLVGKMRRPGADEVRRNPRARSAVLRVAERIANHA